jgi:perosamine synthetase
MPDSFISLSIPNLGVEEKAALADCIDSGWVSTAAPQVIEFEDEIKKFTGIPHGVAVSSGSAGLQLALKALGVQQGDLVLIPNLTFIATANAVIHLGAAPILIDVNGHSWHMDETLVAKFLSEECEISAAECIHKISKRRVWGFITVDVMGFPVSPVFWESIAEKYFLNWVSDSAAALGSFINGKHAGSNAHASVISFNGNKIMTTGAGGMVLTNQSFLEHKIKKLATQSYAGNPSGEYYHDGSGYNFKMSGLNAALGLAQLKKMPQFLQRKKEIYEFYFNAFEGKPGICPFRNPLPEIAAPNHWLFNIAVSNPKALNIHLRRSHIDTRRIWVPLHRQPPLSSYQYLSMNDESETIYEYALSLPCSTSITDEELHRVARAVIEFYS